VVKLWKIMDVKLTIGDIFDKLLVDPGPAGENINRRTKGIGRITLVCTMICQGNWRGVLLFKTIETVHKPGECVLNGTTKFLLVIVHGGFKIWEASLDSIQLRVRIDGLCQGLSVDGVGRSGL